MFVFTTSFNDTQVNGSLAHGDTTMPLWAAKALLFTNVFTPNPDLTMDDMTEAEYEDYAREAVVWNGPQNEGDGSRNLVGSGMYFECGGDASPQAITGYGLAAGNDSTFLIGSETFGSPISMTASGDAFALLLKLNFGAPNPVTAGTVVQ